VLEKRAQCRDLEEFREAVTEVAFAHHTTWDEFMAHVDETQFYYYGHLARDSYLLDTYGFTKFS